MFRCGKMLLRSCAILLSLTFVFGVSACKKKMPEDAVAMIHDQALKDFEFILSLESQKDALLGEAGIEKNTDDAATFLNEEVDGVKRIDKAKEDAVNSMLQYKIMLSMAEKDKIKLTDEDLAEIDAELDRQIKNYESEQDFINTFLSPYKLNIEQYKELMKNYKINDKFYLDYAGKIEVSEEEIIAAFEEEKENVEETVTVKHVLITYEGTEDSTRTKEQSKALAEEVLAKLNDGAEMETLVGEYSEDPGAVQNQGEYTFSQSDSYVQSFKDWGFGASDGDTGIVESEYGYHVMQYISRNLPTIDEYRENIKGYLQGQKFEAILIEMENDEKYKPVINHAVYDAIS